MDVEDIPTTENSPTGVYGGGWLQVIHNCSILHKGYVPCHGCVVPLKNIRPFSFWAVSGTIDNWNWHKEEGHWYKYKDHFFYIWYSSV